MNHDFAPLAGFSGMVRLFPLPNLVFFPQVMQPLHVFEPRYRQMTADALDGDGLIALVLHKPGWETDYNGSPPLHSVACLGKIVADQKLKDGRFNILLRGLTRVQICHEIPHNKAYRKAKVDLLAEVPVEEPMLDRRLRRRLAKLVPHWFPDQEEIRREYHKLLKSDLSLGALCDIFSFALPLELEIKQQLLEELEVGERLTLLLDHLKTKSLEEAVSARRFPPEFSLN